MNEHKVPIKQWRKWGYHARTVFNGTFADILRIGQTCFLHPDTIKRGLSPAEFSAIAWNAAWIAADQSQNPGDITEQVITVGPRPRLGSERAVRAAVKRVRLDPTRSKRAMVAAGRALSAPGPR